MEVMVPKRLATLINNRYLSVLRYYRRAKRGAPRSGVRDKRVGRIHFACEQAVPMGCGRSPRWFLTLDAYVHYIAAVVEIQGGEHS